MVLADPNTQGAVTAVINTTPVGTEYGPPVREASTDVTGVVMPAGGSGVRGWLSAILQKLLTGSQDALAGPSVGVLGGLRWNGSAWDRQYGNTQSVVLVSAARTATTTSP